MKIPISALQLDGKKAYAMTSLDVQPDTLPVTTWEAWVKPAQLNSPRWQSILSSDEGAWDRLVGLQKYGQSFVVGTGASGWQPTTATVNQWQHIAVVYLLDNILFYKNGQEFSLGQAPVGQCTMRPLHFGKSPLYYQYFHGALAEVRIWLGQRSGDDIRRAMGQRLTGKIPGLVAHWQFGELQGNLAMDCASPTPKVAALAGNAVIASTDLQLEPCETDVGCAVPAPASMAIALPTADFKGQYQLACPQEAMPHSFAEQQLKAEPRGGMGESEDSSPQTEDLQCGVDASGATGGTSLSTYFPDTGPYDNPATDTDPTVTLPSPPNCTIRGQTIFEIRKMRSDAKQIGLSIMYEIQTMEKRKAYIEQMTAYLDDRVRELNKVKRDLADEQKWISVSNARIAELAQKEKLIKLQDVTSCIKTEQDRLMGERGGKNVLLHKLAIVTSTLENDIKTIRSKMDQITGQGENRIDSD